MKAEQNRIYVSDSGDYSAAIQNIEVAEKEAKALCNLHPFNEKIEHVAVVGGGTMGSGIAYALLRSSIRTTILEVDSKAVNRARRNIESIFHSGLQRNLITEVDVQRFRSRLEVSTDIRKTADATLVIEAVFEDMDVKKSVFAALEQNVSESTVLASNTSYLDINELASSISNPSRLLGLHFFVPAYIMRLLEVVPGNVTSKRALSVGLEVSRLLEKFPVLSGVCNGFIGNRILARYREAADTILMDGALPWEIDHAMVAFGYAMGPYEAQDLTGLDIAFANRRRQDSTRDPNRRYIPIADRLVELGRLGRKSSCGWYQYLDSGKKEIDTEVETIVLQEAEKHGVKRRHYSESEIQDRIVVAMINEAADILFEGIAKSSRDIDLVTVLGYGFPRWRGGLMYFADSIGVDALLGKLEQFAGEDSLVWKPSPALNFCAKSELRLADYRPKISRFDFLES